MLFTLLGVLLATVGIVGVVSYLNASFIVNDLSAHILGQTAERIHDRIRTLLDGAALLSDVHRESLTGRRLSAADFPRLLPHFHESMRLARQLTYISLGTESGAYCHVYRRPADGGLEVRTREIQADGRTLRIDFRLEGNDLVEIARGFDSYDPRPRPYYRHAKRVGHQTWPDVYLFRNDPNPDYPGLTCATPIFGPEHDFQGVMTADFDLAALGRFLARLRFFGSGRAFVVEYCRNGRRRVIAHPDPTVLIGEVEVDGVTKTDILPVERITSAPIREMMKEVPALADRGDPDRSPPLARVAFKAEGVRYVGAYLPLRSRHDVRWMIGMVVPWSDLMGPVERSNRQTLLIGVASLIAAAVVAIALARRFSHPLTQLARESVSIGRLRLDPGPATDSRVAELARLTDAMEEMKAGLRSFQKFVPAELVRNVITSGRDLVLGGERRVLTVSFTDVANFTESAESMTPEDLVQVLGDYFEAVSEAVTATNGTVDKYIGDAVMAFWGAPLADEHHAAHACRAACAARERLESLRRRWQERNLPAWETRTGIATGELVVGNIGSASRFNYSVIGDTVNLASRLESLNKFYGTSILISGATYHAARGGVVARPLERVAVKGRRQGIMVYELLGLAGAVGEETRRLVRLSRFALARYQRRDFAAAADLFRQVLELRPRDRAATLLADSAAAFARTPPPADWDGIRRMDRK